MEAHAHDATANPKKRSLDEVVPPAFVEEDDSAYGVVEMPKCFVLGNHDHNKHHDKWSARMAAYHAMDVRITVLNESTRRSSDALLQRLRAKDATRAATVRQASGDS